MNLKGKKFLLIGGAGLIGSHTVDLLLKRKVKKIIIFDNFSRDTKSNLDHLLNNKTVEIFDLGGDVLQKDVLEKAMISVDGVFHFAALWLLHCNDFPESAFEVNIRGTFNVLEACRKLKIKKLVYSSSASVYGDAIEEPMEETHPFNNKNFYGATKIASEAMITAYHHRYKLDFIGLRYMNVYGERQDYKGAYISVIMRMLDNIERSEPPKIFGNGSEAFDFINVKDCALANVLAMESNVSGEFYNIGTGEKTTLKELANILLKLKKSKLKIIFEKNNNFLTVKNRIGSTLKAKREIKFNSKISLRKGLEQLIIWKNKK
ncbi:NAD-dependent epimerase/dehydratase family protein [Pelagibacteraceae bacterium]|nr:NAD-dependent epimerase/dehydratase family protein [Pelagibacteraceae bacterium]